MTTALPKVRVSPVEAERGFTITCSACPSWKLLRPLPRQEADLLAVEHRAGHQTPYHDPDDLRADISWRID